jgi:hypothetical protein
MSKRLGLARRCRAMAKRGRAMEEETEQLKRWIEGHSAVLQEPIVLPPCICEELKKRGIVDGYIASGPIPITRPSDR